MFCYINPICCSMINWGGIDEDFFHHGKNWPISYQGLKEKSMEPTDSQYTSIWIEIFKLNKVKPSQYHQIIWTQILKGERILKKTTLWDCRGERNMIHSRCSNLKKVLQHFLWWSWYIEEMFYPKRKAAKAEDKN